MSSGISLFASSAGMPKANISAQSSNRVVGGANAGIYQFQGASGKQYIGKSVNITERIIKHTSTGKYQGGPVNIQGMPYATNQQLRIQEQIRINEAGGINSLENQINSIAPRYWDDLNIQGP